MLSDFGHALLLSDGCDTSAQQCGAGARAVTSRVEQESQRLCGPNHDIVSWALLFLPGVDEEGAAQGPRAAALVRPPTYSKRTQRMLPCAARTGWCSRAAGRATSSARASAKTHDFLVSCGHGSTWNLPPDITPSERSTICVGRDPESLTLEPPAPVRIRNFLMRCFSADVDSRAQFHRRASSSWSTAWRPSTMRTSSAAACCSPQRACSPCRCRSRTARRCMKRRRFIDARPT